VNPGGSVDKGQQRDDEAVEVVGRTDKRAVPLEARVLASSGCQNRTRAAAWRTASLVLPR
jgi:hypothetical protein